MKGWIVAVALCFLVTGCADVRSLRFRFVEAQTGKPLPEVRTTLHSTRYYFFNNLGTKERGCTPSNSQGETLVENLDTRQHHYLKFEKSGFLQASALMAFDFKKGEISISSPDLLRKGERGSLTNFVSVEGTIVVPMHRAPDR